MVSLEFLGLPVETDYLVNEACLGHLVQWARLEKMGTKENLANLERRVSREQRAIL